MRHAVDKLILVPDEVDRSRSPLAGQFDAETYVLGVFNPGLTRLPNGNLLMMARVAEALRAPIFNGNVHAIRWEADGATGRYVLDAWPLEHVDTADPRKFLLRGGGWRIMALTSLSWLLPVELSPDGLKRIVIRYDRAIAPAASWQCYGVEDARISRVGRRYLMTTCSVSPERHSTTLYVSDDGLVWRFADILLDHQNKDMVIFEGRVAGITGLRPGRWATTRSAWARDTPVRNMTVPVDSPTIGQHTDPSVNTTKPQPVTRAPRLPAVIIAAVIVAIGAIHPAMSDTGPSLESASVDVAS